MDELEKFIRNNKDEFNLETPDPKLWAGIAEESNKETKRRFIIPMKSMRIAASFLILALAFYGGYNLLTSPSESGSTATNSDLPSELVEIDNYYETQVASYVSQVEAQITDQEVLQSVYDDLESLNQEKQSIKDGLSEGLDNQELIEALVATYRMKLEVLENILSLLKENNEENDLHI